MAAKKKSRANVSDTHYPGRNGAICGFHPVPTDAHYYSVDKPSCPDCADWVKAMARMPAHPSALPASSGVAVPGWAPDPEEEEEEEEEPEDAEPPAVARARAKGTK